MSANQVLISLAIILFGAIVTSVYKHFFGKDVKIVDTVPVVVDYEKGTFTARYQYKAGDVGAEAGVIKGENIAGVTISTIAYPNQNFVEGMTVHYRIKKGETTGAEITEIVMPQA